MGGSKGFAFSEEVRAGVLRGGGGGRNGCVGSTHCKRKSLSNVYSVSSSRRTGKSGGNKPSLYHDCINEAFHGPNFHINSATQLPND